MDNQSSPHSWDLTRATLVLTWFLTSLAIISVLFRFYLRRKFFNGWASHDWLMLAALAFQFSFQVGLTAMCSSGSGRPSSDLTELELVTIIWHQEMV